jgi:sialate O-acetylesterase
MQSIRLLPSVVAVSAVLHVPALAVPVLDALFQDHAVLQCDKAVPVWGRAAPGEHVSVAFAGQTVGATTGLDGRWIVVLAPMAAASSGSDLTVSGNGSVSARDVVIGEVWLCAGGSGMEFAVGDGSGPRSRVRDAEDEVAAARYPLIRQFKIAAQSSARPVEEALGDWKVCSPETVGKFSAVGYFFARDLHARLGVPFGIINSTRAGAPIASWMSPLALGGIPAVAGARPASGDPSAPSSEFNAMIHPLLQYAVRGVIWYQGEGDVGRASEYAVQFPRLISAWRAHFGQGDIPFLWVQLANGDQAGDGPADALAYLREAQSRALVLPSTGQAVAIDIGGDGDSRGRRIQEVGRRLSLIAKAKAYSIPVDYSGPAFRETAVEGRSVRVRFSPVGDGLTASGKPLQSFEVAGPDRVFHPAVAVIQGDAVVVSSVAVAGPVAVRYAWRNAPAANLYNGEGLPAGPFRSDDW